MTESYWNHKGKHEELAIKLQKLVPVQGSVDKPRGKNKALEKFRRASNCYYDLYNNGLCNRAQAFRGVFDIRPSDYKYGFGRYFNSMYEIVEKKMDEIVHAAAKEQGVV